jgi:hypothetical protein
MKMKASNRQTTRQMKIGRAMVRLSAERMKKAAQRQKCWKNGGSLGRKMKNREK